MLQQLSLFRRQCWILQVSVSYHIEFGISVECVGRHDGSRSILSWVERLLDNYYHVVPNITRIKLIYELCLSLQCGVLSDVRRYAPDNGCQPQQVVVVEEAESVLEYVGVVVVSVLPSHRVHPDLALASRIQLTMLRHWLRTRPAPHH